jgi:hypothetical protein
MAGSLIHCVLLGAILLWNDADAQRIAPASPLKCDRNHLTSFMGRVVSYRRDSTHIAIRMRTDEKTNESFEIKLVDGDSAEKHFLMRGEIFQPNDWQAVEASRSVLKPGMRAIIWVCDDGSAPVIDWRPPEP